MLISSCGSLGDLREDNRKTEQNYGYIAGRVSGADEGSNVLVGLFERGEEELSIYSVRTVSLDEHFYFPVQKAEYEIMAFLDSNGDFAYQPGEPAVHLDDPDIIWAKDMKLQADSNCVDYDAVCSA